MNKQIRRSTTSIMDLPEDFFIGVLLRLSARSIISCKCVCKSWRSLVSSHDFAKTHLAQRKTGLLIRNVQCTCYSRTLYLLEAEDYCNFDLSKCWCQPCQTGNAHLCRCLATLDDKLKIPLRNTEAMTDVVHDYDPILAICSVDRSLHCDHESIKKQLENHRYNIANSCDGLLFLIEPSLQNSVAICNPITGEFICYRTPIDPNFDNRSFVLHGLGFGPKKNQYKMVRMCVFDGTIFVQIHTTGTNRWRSTQHRNVAGLSEISSANLHYSPTCFCGVLHWAFADSSNDSNCLVLCFDLDDEIIYFRNILISPSFKDGNGHSLSMGILEGHLCLYDTNNMLMDGDVLEIWMMKEEYAAWDSWTKVFSRNVSHEHGYRGAIYKPLSYTNNGGLLIDNSLKSEFLHYDRSESLVKRCIIVEAFEGRFETIAHTPSFISLKDLASPEDEVQNINFRCGDLKLEEERYPVFIEGEYLHTVDSEFLDMLAAEIL